ncbi:MAG: Fic family protein [Nocardioidaceae bacterium]
MHADHEPPVFAADWPPHVQEIRPYSQRVSRGPRADRALREVAVNLPPHIRDLDFPAEWSVMAMVTASTGDIGHLDLVHGRTLAALGHLQLRAEAIDSSKIEDIDAGLADYGRALLGVGASASARSMAAATTALKRMIDVASSTRRITPDTVLQAHRELFRSHPDEQERAGRFRVVQNWVGGSDYSPRDALWVPPPPELVPDYLDDLFAFANRDDLPALIQAAIAHAQFESIHPFIDGNGRIGRALIHAILRRRRAARHLIVPVASALVAHRERYFTALGEYRRGHAAPIVTLLARSANVATTESWRAVDAIVEVRQSWDDLVDAKPGTPVYRLLDMLTEEPMVNATLVAQHLRLPPEGVRQAIDTLVRAGVLSLAPKSRRSPVWLAKPILAELDALSTRIQDTSRRLGESHIRHR